MPSAAHLRKGGHGERVDDPQFQIRDTIRKKDLQKGSEHSTMRPAARSCAARTARCPRDASDVSTRLSTAERQRYRATSHRGEKILGVHSPPPRLRRRPSARGGRRGQEQAFRYAIGGHEEVLFDGIPPRLSVSMTDERRQYSQYWRLHRLWARNRALSRPDGRHDTERHHSRVHGAAAPHTPPLLMPDYRRHLQIFTARRFKFNSSPFPATATREAGGDGIELAYTLADGLGIAPYNLSMTVDRFAPRLSFFWGGRLEPLKILRLNCRHSPVRLKS